MSSKKFLIVSGGTGGHIFPAIVFGKKLESDGHIVKWLCGSRPLEQEIYKSQGIQPLLLKISGSPLGTHSLIKNFGRAVDLAKSVIQTSSYIKNFKPDEIYLFGGYISFAPLMVGKSKRIPITLHEQNAVAGKVTKLAAKLGAKIITAWPVCEGIKNFTCTGTPVREPERLPRVDALKTLDLNISPDSKIIGIAGGSLGSKPLLELLTNTAKLCKKFDFVFLSSHEKRDDDNRHYILPHWDMNAFYSICDLIVCRAGGSTLSEILKWEIPAIVIPWPKAADNHQAKNAAEFVKLAKNSCVFNENDSPQNLAGRLENLF
ncbi:MAG: UDP-N-acetylglucosamine--N-acetylmuramyl-(pentapeptide) pyrophosphoryl-undecaprenol N-acetylglucosamine transferase [Synergistaceae bacterium]|nr:UDP-N-acetylglucosamine--N-acetylmuramyl-(pentapeptide) pyrophosphoryl-undecaprenol N-acetylglucosamine transferase [Synergistaceae bacterium]